MDTELISSQTAQKIGGGGGVLALAYSVFDWFKKSTSLKNLKGQMQELSRVQAKQTTTIAVIEATMVKKEDLATMATKEDLVAIITSLTQRIDNLFEQAAR